MLIVTESAEERLKEAKELNEQLGFADDSPDSLISRLAYLDTYAENGERGRTRCVLATDFAPFSFFFRMQIRREDGEYEDWFPGGLIYHGPHDRGGDGGAPTFSVNLIPVNGWSIHT